MEGTGVVEARPERNAGFRHVQRGDEVPCARFEDIDPLQPVPPVT